MSGLDDARELANKIKEGKESEARQLESIRNQLSQISGNQELANLYKDNAQVGAENLASGLPWLKVHFTGKSVSNLLQDGSEPNDGWFFYRPTSQQFETVECHILTISKGFKSEGMENKREVFSQIIGGVIVDKSEYKPFILWMSGKKLNPLWGFCEVANKYTHAKPIPVPMFALLVRMKTEKVNTSLGTKTWIINFDIMLNEDKSPILVTDVGKFQFLKDSVGMVEETISSLISAKTISEDDEVLSPDRVIPSRSF